MSRASAFFVFLAGLNGLAAILAGAWAAHGFGVPLAPGGDVLAETGSRFQMWHALALLAVGLAHEAAPRADGPLSYLFGTRSLLRWSGIAFLVGIAAFSGGLYLTAGGQSLSGLAPVGGIAFIVGWCLFTLAGLVRLLAPRY